MADDPAKTLSDKIEETIEGALRFVVRFFRTVVVILFRPLSCDRILLESLSQNRKFVRPLTFLAIGGFVFSLTISVYPKGFLGLINIIWFDEEVSGALAQRWQEALSITGLIVAAFPVLLTVSACAGLAGRRFAKPRRDEFVALNGYLFGYQYFLLFSFFFISIFVAVLRELFGVEVRELLGIENFQISELVKQTLYFGLLLLFFSALLMPAIALGRWLFRSFPSRAFACKAAACAIMSIYCLVVLALCSYTASAPAAFKHVTAPKPDKITVEFLRDPYLRFSKTAPDGRHIIDFDLHIVIENIPKRHLVARRSDITVGIVGEFKDKRAETLSSSDDLKIQSNGQDVHDIVIAKDGLQTYRLTGSIELYDATFKLIRQKVDKPYESNDFGFFVNIRIRQGSDVTDRRLSLDVDKLFK